MRVADYRWIANAAALGAAGWLQDDGDIASRQSRIVHLDDEAIVFEGVQERRDLCGDNAYQTHTLRRTLHRWNSGAPIKATQAVSPLWNDFLNSHQCYTASACQQFFNVSGLTPLPLAVVGSTIADALAQRCGLKSPPSIPANPIWRLLSLRDARQASNAMFETNAFYLFCGHTTDNNYNNLDSYHVKYKAWMRDSRGLSSQSAYDKYWSQPDAETAPWQSEIFNQLTIDIYKDGGVTSWVDQCSMIGCLLEWSCINYWGDYVSGTEGRRTGTGVTPLLLEKKADGHFRFDGAMTSSDVPFITSICGNHSVSLGYMGINAELIGLHFVGVFQPIAATVASI